MAQFNKNTHSFLPNGTSLFEVVMVADQYGNPVSSGNPSGVATDAFGRARMSEPYTLFEATNVYRMNGSFASANSGGTYTANTSISAVEMEVGTGSGNYVYRETKRTFAYQPGKSLLTLNTFVFNEPKENLRQRVGYFGANNGIYLEQSSNTITFNIRSSTMDDQSVEQASWNIDPLDGNGPSLKTLDLTKAQIFWTDVEWLGVGSVRCGFVIDGQMIHCHTFNNANHVIVPYMLTATLPVRFEIENVGETSSNSTMLQICSSVISEGGYQLQGTPKTIGHPPGTLVTMSTKNTWYPIASIRLKPGFHDAVVVPTDVAVIPDGNSGRIRYKLVRGATLNGAWVDAGSDSSVEYNLTANTISGGDDMSSGYIAISNQSISSVNLADGRFKFQLRRDSFAGTSEAFTIACSPGTDGDDVAASIDWEEVAPRGGE